MLLRAETSSAYTLAFYRKKKYSGKREVYASGKLTVHEKSGMPWRQKKTRCRDARYAKLAALECSFYKPLKGSIGNGR
jgi:hypothetical protein